MTCSSDDYAGWRGVDGVSVRAAQVGHAGADVPVRLYTPPGDATAVVVWVHGGGFVAGGLDMPESHVVAAELASRSDAAVVAVDYRLAPAARYPAPIDDVEAAFLGARELAAAPAEVPLIVGGASAGAALVLAAALRASVPVAAVVLAYPFVHFPVPALDVSVAVATAAAPQAMRFPAESIEDMVRSYVGRLWDLPADALPGSAVPRAIAVPVHVVAAELDELRPSGELLVRQFHDAGGEAQLHLERGTTHGYLNLPPGAPGVDTTLDWIAGAIARTVAAGTSG